jgi:tetratricopeptide (TPR) repeat protein
MFNLKVFFTTLILIASSSSFAQLEVAIDKAKLDKLKSDLEVRTGGLVSDLFNRRMERIGGEIAREDYKRAIELLDSLVESTKTNRFENALALQNLGVTYLQSGDNKKGIETLNKALDSNALNYDQTLNVYYTLAQVNLAAQNRKQALQHLEEWFYISSSPTTDAYILKAAIYADANDYKKALQFVEEGLKLTKAPREEWLSFAAGLYFETKNNAKAAEMFKQLAGVNPKERRYWKQLSGIYVNQDRFDEALTAMILADKMGHLADESDILNICNLYNYNEIPINCARILTTAIEKKEVKNLDRAHTLLSQAYIQAREPMKAIPSLNHLAAKEKTGKFEAQIGYIHYQLQDWTKASKSFGDALKKGGFEQEKKADLILSKGISEYQNKKYAEAINTLTELRSIEGHTQQANAWLKEINQKVNPQ